MTGSKKCFTFIWKIRNFSFICNQIASPSFYVDAKGVTKWKLILNPNSDAFKDCVVCHLHREINGRAPYHFQLDFELSFLDGDGSALHSEIFLKKVFKSSGTNYQAPFYVKREEVFLLKKDLFIPDDTLTIRCRMWNNQPFISQSGRCFAETRIETDCRTFVGTIKTFSSAEPISKNLFCIKSSKETFLSSMSLCVATDGKLAIEMKLVDMESLHMHKCRIFIRDIYGNKVKFGHGEFQDIKPHTIPLTLLKEHLMENKGYYLPNDVLTIECEIIFPVGKTVEKLKEPEYGSDFQETICDAMKMNFSLNGHHTDSITTLTDDLISLFSEGILYDTKLKTPTEAFPAHTIVLSARSSVFKSMFATDMKEKTNNCVDINDLDAGTVRQMLLFMYTDTLDGLEYENAKSLYFAADKYNIVSLRHRCSNFLKLNLLHSNCCDILLLADKHQDKDLKNAVQNYIAENDEVVLFSDEWKNLETNHPQLTIEVLRAVYMKNRRSC